MSMLIYGKTVDNATHLYGTLGAIPSNSDNQLVYKDYDGDVITLVSGDSYVDGGSANGIQRIIRKSDGKVVNVFIGDACVIGEVVTPKVIKKIVITTKPTKLEYVVDDKLDLTGLVVSAVYADGDSVAIAGTAYTTSPADDSVLDTAGTVKVTVTHTESSKTASFNVTVVEAEQQPGQ